MHRNSEAKNKERLDLITSTALRLYREKSSSEVSVLDICKACEMTKPTFYKYVGSKEMILAHYFQGSAAEAVKDMEIMNEQDHLSRIFYGVTYGLRKAERNDADLLKSYMNYCLKEHIPSCLCGEQWKNAVLKELDLAKKEGQICTDASPELLFKSLGALALGMAMQSACDGREEDMYKKYIENASSILLLSSTPRT